MTWILPSINKFLLRYLKSLTLIISQLSLKNPFNTYSEHRHSYILHLSHIPTHNRNFFFLHLNNNNPSSRNCLITHISSSSSRVDKFVWMSSHQQHEQQQFELRQHHNIFFTFPSHLLRVFKIMFLWLCHAVHNAEVKMTFGMRVRIFHYFDASSEKFPHTHALCLCCSRLSRVALKSAIEEIINSIPSALNQNILLIWPHLSQNFTRL